MNLRSVDLNLLTVFDAVYTEGNMSRASDKIGMSQPALSLAISRFRRMAGDELFERTGRGVRPTPRARELAVPVRRALDMIASALEQGVGFDATTSDRTFNLMLSDYGDLLLIPRLMEWLEEQEAKIRISTRSFDKGEARSEMHFGDIDLFLWLEPLDRDNDEFISQRLGADSNVCLVRADHPDIGNSLSLEEFAKLKHVVLRLPDSYGPTLIDRELWSHGLQREHSMTIHSIFEFPRVLGSTSLIASMPVKIAEHFATGYGLRVVPSPIDFETPIYLSWPRSMDRDPGHQWLRDFLIKSFKEM